MAKAPKTILATEVTPRLGSNYPGKFADPCKQREKRALGDAFGLTQFGVNLTTLPPGAWSSQRHWHAEEDEFIYVLDGELVLIDEDGETVLKPGMSVGFKAGIPNGHHLLNRSNRAVSYLEVGTRALKDTVDYPDIDLRAVKFDGGPPQPQHADGTPY